MSPETAPPSPRPGGGAGRLLALLTQERPRPARVAAWPSGWWLAVGTVCLGAFMGQLDASIVTLTYRPLGTEFGASLAAVQWVSLSYLLVLAALLVPLGRLSDARGRKLVYLYGFVVFTAASAACGLAPTLGALIGFRVVQGIGAAMLQANGVALVVTSAPVGRTRAALGVQAAAQALGLALGPTVGGLLVSTLGWRWVFGINVPVGIAAVVAGIYLLPRTRELHPRQGRDLSGLALLAVAITAALLGVSAVSGLGVPGWVALVLLGLAAAGIAGFVARERRARAPMLDLAVLGTPAVRGGLLGALSGYLVLFGPLVVVPTALIDIGYSALHAGLVLSALPVGFALGASTGDRLLPRSWTDHTRARVGSLVAVAALLALAALPRSIGSLVPLLVVLGWGLGTFTPANNNLVMHLVPASLAGTGGSLLTMARSLGTALGVAVVTLVLHLRPQVGGPADGPAIALLALAVAGIGTVLSARRGGGGLSGTAGEGP
jgi:EmrB/QacA subfamily drug resistance transporter